MLTFFEKKSKNSAICKSAQINFNNWVPVVMLSYSLQKATIQKHQQIYINKKKMNLLSS